MSAPGHVHCCIKLRHCCTQLRRCCTQLRHCCTQLRHFPRGYAVEESLCTVGTSHLHVLHIVAIWLHNHQQTGTNSTGCQHKLQ